MIGRIIYDLNRLDLAVYNLRSRQLLRLHRFTSDYGLDFHFKVNVFTTVDVLCLQESRFESEDIKMPQCLQVVPVVLWRAREDRIDGAEQACDGFICPGQCVPAISKEE